MQYKGFQLSFELPIPNNCDNTIVLHVHVRPYLQPATHHFSEGSDNVQVIIKCCQVEGSVPVVLEQVDVLHKPTVEVLHSSAGGIRVWIIHAVYTRALI